MQSNFSRTLFARVTSMQICYTVKFERYLIIHTIVGESRACVYVRFVHYMYLLSLLILLNDRQHNVDTGERE